MTFASCNQETAVSIFEVLLSVAVVKTTGYGFDKRGAGIRVVVVSRIEPEPMDL
jgi:hypothetical protein